MAATVEGHEAKVAFYADGEAGGHLLTSSLKNVHFVIN